MALPNLSSEPVGATTLALPSRRRSPEEPPPTISDYRFIKPIGKGAFGTVWLAEETLVGIFRAVKVLSPAGREPDDDPSSRSSTRHIERELEGLRAYQTRTQGHPHIVQLLKTGLCQSSPLPRGEGQGEGRDPPPAPSTAGPVDSSPQGSSLKPQASVYYVMEIADHAGGAVPLWPNDYEPQTLSTLLRQKGRLRVEQVIEYATHLLDAIEHLHKAGIHHRDIKPSNVLFVGGAIKLADLGLVGEETEQRMGTPGYLPPEGKPDDLYALGKLIYEMTTGLPASAFPEWPGDLVGSQSPERERRVWRVLHRGHRAGALGSDLHPLKKLRDLINRLCHPSASKRLSNVLALQADLRALASPRNASTVTRRRMAAILGIALPFSLLVGGYSL